MLSAPSHFPVRASVLALVVLTLALRANASPFEVVDLDVRIELGCKGVPFPGSCQPSVAPFSHAGRFYFNGLGPNGAELFVNQVGQVDVVEIDSIRQARRVRTHHRFRFTQAMCTSQRRGRMDANYS